MKYVVYKDFENVERVIMFNGFSIGESVEKLGLLSVVSAGIAVISCTRSTDSHVEVSCFNDPHEDNYTSRLELDAMLINNYIA